MLYSENEQKEAVTLFLARLACRMEGLEPCSVCVRYVRENFTERAYPVINTALGESYGWVFAAAFYQSLLNSIATMPINPEPDPEEEDEEDESDAWKKGHQN